MTENDPRRLSVADPANPSAALEAALFEIKRVIVGQEAMLERVLVALLAGGHLLLEGVPGLAKTRTIATLAQVLSGSFQRIQFTPDLVPSDLVGTRIWRPDQGGFDTELGPVFCNFLLADEINRAPAKVQSALLEVMQEHQVTIGKHSYPVPAPFLVLATQNPIESDGTYPLPEAHHRGPQPGRPPGDHHHPQPGAAAGPAGPHPTGLCRPAGRRIRRGVV
jgi:MoxR-like ATPase